MTTEWYEPTNFFYIVASIIGSIVGFIGIKSAATKKKEAEKLKLKADFERNQKLASFDSNIEDLKTQIQDVKYQIREDNLKDKKELDEIKLYLKDLSSSAKEGDKVHAELKKEVKELREEFAKQIESVKSFFIDWIQRKEDDINELQTGHAPTHRKRKIRK